MEQYSRLKPRHPGTGEPITDAVYIKRQFGPVPRAILSTLQELQAEGSIVVSEKLYYGKVQKQFHAMRQADTSRFSGGELALIDRIAGYVSESHTAASISDLSHDHIWKAAWVDWLNRAASFGQQGGVTAGTPNLYHRPLQTRGPDRVTIAQGVFDYLCSRSVVPEKSF